MGAERSEGHLANAVTFVVPLTPLLAPPNARSTQFPSPKIEGNDATLRRCSHISTVLTDFSDSARKPKKVSLYAIVALSNDFQEIKHVFGTKTVTVTDMDCKNLQCSSSRPLSLRV